MKTRLLKFVAPLVALSTSACGHHHVNPPAEPYWDGAFWIEPTTSCTDSSPRFLPKFRASDSLPGISEIRHADQLQAWLARHVPGGWAYGPSFNSNHATLWLRDPTQKHAAMAALDSLAPPNQLFAATHADSIVALPVRWDYAELYDWMEVLKTGHTIATGMNMWGIDAANDRIVFGIETRETLDAMVKWLIDKGIPCRLVVVEISGKIYLAGRPTFSLRRLTNVAADKHFSDAASPRWL
jgi:hypothetical protein